MEGIHRQVLTNKTKNIVESLTNPEVMVGVSLVKFFPDSDRQLIEREKDRHGPARASQVLVQLLEKRGPKVYKEFVKALRSSQHKLDDLATEMEQEEARLRGHPIRQQSELTVEQDLHPSAVGRSVSCPPHDRNQFVARGSTGLTGEQSNTMYQHQEYQQPPNDGYEAPGINTLLKDIPTHVHQSIVKLLNVEDALRKDWRAIAGCMKLSVEDTNTLKQDKKMDGLFETMIHKHMHVRDLVEFLASKEVDRRDVIDELKKANLVSDSDLSSFTDEECNDGDITEEISVVTQTVSELEAAESEPQLLSPHQNQTSKCARDDTARHPVQTSSPDKGFHNSSPHGTGAKPPSTPQQETDPKFQGNESGAQNPVQESVDDSESMTSERLEDLQVSDNDGDIHGEGVSKMALIIGCLRYENLDSLENFTRSIKRLHHALDMDDWRVTRRMGRQECSSVVLNNEIQSFVDSSEGNICLVYLVGHTVHMNGVNFLLPTDVNPDMTKADLVACSVNVNQLISSLRTSRLSVVFLDGAHECVQDFQCRAVLKGLAPVSPPPNMVVAYSCRPGTIRTAEERLRYINSLTEHLETENLSVEDLFKRIREDMNNLGASSPPVEYSLVRNGLPFCFNSSEEGSGIRAPDHSTPRHAIILAISRGGPQTPHADHLTASLENAHWTAENHENLSGEGMKTVLRDRLKELSGPDMKVVMVYFIGAAFQTNNGENVLAGVDDLPANNLTVQWIVDLMCELVNGPKLLVVDDDLQTSCERGLADMIAPQECLLSLPCARDSDRPSEYTLRLAQLIGSNPGRSMRGILAKASDKEHRIHSNLFFA